MWGGRPDHEHIWGEALPGLSRDPNGQNLDVLGERLGTGGGHKTSGADHSYPTSGQFCDCGAWLGNVGLEPTPDMFVAHMVNVFREVWRVMRDDGTLWLNLGDSYHSGNRGGYRNDTHRWEGSPIQPKAKGTHMEAVSPNRLPQEGLKDKDLMMMPARVAMALQADGWYLRSDIIWSKPNPMPESVTDRPTNIYSYSPSRSAITTTIRRYGNQVQVVYRTSRRCSKGKTVSGASTRRWWTRYRKPLSPHIPDQPRGCVVIR